MRRLACFDGLRGALAVYVMLTHLAPFAAYPAALAWVPGVMSHGMAGVDLFFILSGLVIVRSLASFEHQPRPFLIARATRIFPAFLAVFAMAIAVQPLATPFAAMPWIGPDSAARDIWASGWPAHWGAHLLAHLTMTHGLFPDGALHFVWVSYLGAAWSLSTEWQFYLLVTLIAGRAGAGQGGLLRLAIGFLVLGAAAAAWRAAAAPDWCFSRAFLPNKAQYFALGIASAALVSAPGGRQVAAYLAVLVGAIVLCSLEAGGTGKLVPPLAWTLCLSAQLRPTAPALRWLARALAASPLVWLGAISYPLYLVNEPIQKLLGIGLAAIAGGSGAVFDLFWLPLAVVLPIAAAWWLHVRIEQPGLRWGRELARRAMAPELSLAG